MVAQVLPLDMGPEASSTASDSAGRESFNIGMLAPPRWARARRQRRRSTAGCPCPGAWCGSSSRHALTQIAAAVVVPSGLMRGERSAP